MKEAPKLSIVIPIAPGELAWRELVSQAVQFPFASEVILSSTESCPPGFEDLKVEIPRLRWISGEKGRAVQLNRGAQSADGNWLLFLHADSTVYPEAFRTLEKVILRNQRALYFFDLKFEKSYTAKMRLNEWGANFRSRILKLPFGDQGYLVKTDLFWQLGGFCADAPYGEDHLFVWKAHQRRIPVKPMGGGIGTSARKYERGGWLKTTALHLQLTAKQALPSLAELIRSRVGP